MHSVIPVGRWKDHVELRNRWVHFKVSDVHIPDADKVLFELYGDHLLQGQVMDISEAGKQGRFAVVKVDGLSTPVIISLDRILGVL
jgi:predicted ester cyclase